MIAELCGLAAVLSGGLGVGLLIWLATTYIGGGDYDE